ncbi:MAG: GDP-mannose 4,6-dehydratase [Nitrospinae bacterium]|nr:GDP-mannose 4,6-dehydratase [Nitrospinota bacterium]MBI3815516.1 GDP-mannose 4,6-dehydratase [Nitrospinota bacterium]
MAKVLITGGAGFIGSHLSEELLKRGDEVFIIDDLSTGSIENIEHLKDNSKFHYTIDTIKNEPLLAELVDRCDMIYHLAAAVGVKLIIESPVNTIETNIYGTELVLKCANKKKKKVMIASTSEVYGKNNNVPFKEEHDMVLGSTKNGRWSYACSKAIDEFLALAYWREKKLPVVVVRFFNTVGPKQTGRYGMVIPTFVKQALLGHPVTVYGDGKQSRSFTYVGDVVRGIIELMNHPKSVGEVFNIGHGKEITISELARLVKEITKSKSEIIYIPYDKAYEEGFEDMQRRSPDITKINKFIGYKPTLDIKEILEKVVEYFLSTNAHL